MPRPWRIEYPGTVYHILSRRNNRQAIFFDDPDRKKFLELSARTLAEKRGIFQHGTRIIIISLKTAR